MEDVLWPGKPLYFAKTSGTTSGAKYIPITKESIHNHIRSARNALLQYVAQTGKSRFLDHKLIFLSGSPVLDSANGIHTGRLSGIVNHHIPSYLRKNQMPSWETNCIEDWETKVCKIADETFNQSLSLIGGIPPWVQMYFDILHEKAGGKRINEIFPHFDLFVYGGVNYEPYRQKMEESIGGRVDSIELFPASEGFFAYQDNQDQEGMLLLLNDGIYYEFIQLDEIHNESPKRISIENVKIGVNYAMVVNSNAGLWGYNLGDTIKFVSIKPYRVIVSGRIKHFISAFGEHVIGEEVEHAILSPSKALNLKVVEFTVAPQVTPSEGGLPYHQWLIEFESVPDDLDSLSEKIDLALREKNQYYDDLISGAVLQRLKIVPLQRDAFVKYMKSKGKLGGQNKVPRLSNDREIADELLLFKQ